MKKKHISEVYGIFNATVNGINNPLQSVIWEIIGINLEVGTTISDGILTVSTFDHGKEITIIATSAVDNNKSSSVTGIAVLSIPSDFFGTWVGINVDETVVITENSFVSDNSFSVSVKNWMAVINPTTPSDNENGNNTVYPNGYAVDHIGTLIMHMYLHYNGKSMVQTFSPIVTATFFSNYEKQ